MVSDYNLIKYIEFLNDENDGNNDFTKCYFNLGQFLVLIYVLRYKKNDVFFVGGCKQEDKYPDICNKWLNLSPSAEEIAKDVLESSLYNIIKGLSEEKLIYPRRHLSSIKLGFQYMYNIILNNKLEMTNLVKSLFNNQITESAMILSKINMLNPKDLKFQLYILDILLYKNKNEETSIKLYEGNLNCKINKKNLLNCAVNLGNCLMKMSIIGFNNHTISRTWINVINRDNNKILSPNCYNLYDGNSGIALFFLYLGLASKKNYFINLALEAMQQSIYNINSLKEDAIIQLGAFNGILGDIYVLSKIYSSTKNNEIKGIVKTAIIKLKKIIKTKKCANVLDGNAGIIAILLSIYDNPDFSDIKDILLELATLCYRQIKHNIDYKKISVGFGYGNDGIIAVLARLLNITKDNEIENTIRDILYFQRNNDCSEQLYGKNGWYNGYAGTLLSKLILKKLNFKDKLIDMEIKKYLELTIKNSFGKNLYYFNGDIGTLEILEYAAEILEDDSLKNRCTITFNNIVETVIEPNINEQIKYENQSLSFMTGITGLGYSLIKKYSDVSAPQVLWLE